MKKKPVGYRFSPTGLELINHYLKNKILDKLWLVNDAINEINICAHDPKFLPALSKLDSKDLVWYFFCRREYHVPEKKKGTKRTTPSGYWKATGVDRKIREKGVEIGIKKTLVYHEGKSTNGVWTPWVMHEYHITSLPPTQRNYVICQVMYKGADGDSLYGNNSNELSHSTMVSDLNTVREINTAPEVEQPREEDFYMSWDDLANPLNEQDDPSLFNPDTFFNDDYCPYQQQPQAPCDDDYISKLLSFNGGNHADVLGDLDITMQEHRNDHRPTKAFTGIIVDCSSDNDAKSISATVSIFGISSTTNNPFRFTISYLGKGIKKRIGISFSQLKDLLVGKKKLGRTFYLHLNKKIYMNSEIRDYAFLKVKKKTRKPIKKFHYHFVSSSLKNRSIYIHVTPPGVSRQVVMISDRLKVGRKTLRVQARAYGDLICSDLDVGGLPEMDTSRRRFFL
ncbi:unnamed protein product [Brassica rapa]|uniref:NAC domain-containing protein n=1 Tax=Brassica campestris TaxID=3711 RepID=A0A8D9CR45_BRACM|nr:unnamed protein product [Brassica rapa]